MDAITTLSYVIRSGLTEQEVLDTYRTLLSVKVLVVLTGKSTRVIQLFRKNGTISADTKNLILKHYSEQINSRREDTKPEIKNDIQLVKSLKQQFASYTESLFNQALIDMRVSRDNAPLTAKQSSPIVTDTRVPEPKSNQSVSHYMEKFKTKKNSN